MCEVCVGCQNWNDGEGTRDCLKCQKIERLIPSVDSGMGGNVHSHEVLMPPERLERLKVPSSRGGGDDVPCYMVDNRERVLELAEQLQEKERVVVLSRLEGKSFNMIARENGLRKEHVWNTYKNATRKLRHIAKRGGAR